MCLKAAMLTLVSFFKKIITKLKSLFYKKIQFGNITGKKPTSDINICRLYQGLRFHSQWKDGTNPTSIWHT